MRTILFDLGDTLIDKNDKVLPGAIEVLTALANLRDPDGASVPFGLVSDYYDASSPAEVRLRQEEYYSILHSCGLASFFEPLSQRVTLSTEVGVSKPDPLIFRTAVERLSLGAHLHHAVFVTENSAHIEAARELGMMAIHVKGPGQSVGEVEHLAELIPILQRLVAFAPCCKKRGEAVGRHESHTHKSKKADPTITGLTAKVSSARLKSWIETLAGFGTRWTHSPGIGRVPEWVRDQFLALGYPGADVRFQEFDVPGAVKQRNVLCGPAGSHPGFLLLCAHYDSLSQAPKRSAPGADDNATGVAVLLEVAGLLRGVPLRRGLLFAAFGGEEQGLFGSAACAEVAAAEGWKIDVVLNMDMIGYQDPARPGRIVVEYDQGNRHPGNDAAAKAFGALMAQAAADYTTLEVEHTDIWNSDYIPFEAKGYPCIGVFEATENPGYHKTTDTLGALDMNHLAEVAKMVLATTYRIAL